MIDKKMMEHDPEAKELLLALEDYTIKFNTLQALRVYGIPEESETFKLARLESGKALERIVKIHFPQYVS